MNPQICESAKKQGDESSFITDLTFHVQALLNVRTKFNFKCILFHLSAHSLETVEREKNKIKVNFKTSILP